MLKKLKLDQTKKYEHSIAVNEIVRMVVAFVKGRRHYLSIGAEQGDIPKWDDLIIQDSSESFIHIQVKRQITDFSRGRNKCIRDRYVQNRRIGEWRDLSPFDEAIKGLADWVRENDPTTSHPKRGFVVEIPESNTQIKDGLEIRHFRALCENHIKRVTDIAGLEELQNVDSSVKNCFDWLRTWCGFENWNHILSALQILQIKTSGLESDIDFRTEETLKEIFCAERVREIRLKIGSYLDENTTFTGAIQPRQLLFGLQDFLLIAVPSWTQFQKQDRSWKISGIHDLERHDIIERPSVVVPFLWSNGKVKNLKIAAPVNKNCKLSDSLIQLAIHQNGQVNTHCTDADGWKRCIEEKIGNTLGTSKEDLENLNFIQDREPFFTSEYKILNLRRDHESIAEELKNEMIAKTWSLVSDKVGKKLDEMEGSELRDALELNWISWESQLSPSTGEQNFLFKNILQPNAEGEDILGELRIGAKTSNLIADGIYILLIVSVCIGDENSNWKYIREHSVNTIGLSCWSGPSGKKKSVRFITDEGILDLIGKESSDIVILSSTEVSPSEIYDEDLMGGTYEAESLASPNLPKLLVTNHPKFRRLVKKGEIGPLKGYLNSFLQKREILKEEAIKKVII